MKITHYIFYCIISIFLSACISLKEDKLSGLAECAASNEDRAVICGRALATDRVTPLINARISLESSNDKLKSAQVITQKGVANSEKCLTDNAGDFVCLLPEDVSGSVRFELTHTGFETYAFSADTSVGKVKAVSNLTLAANQHKKWAVIPSTDEGVQVLLAQLKGCVLNDLLGNPFEAATGKPQEARSSFDCESKGLLVLDTDSTATNYPPDFLVSDRLATYDTLFINSHADHRSSVVNTALQEFVTTGKHIYFSGLADQWLTIVFPNKITFLENDTRSGTLSAVVAPTGLQSVVGTNMDIRFDTNGWISIASVTDEVTTFLEADITSLSNSTGTRPITVGWY